MIESPHICLEILFQFPALCTRALYTSVHASTRTPLCCNCNLEAQTSLTALEAQTAVTALEAQTAVTALEAQTTVTALVFLLNSVRTQK
jgi:hypothetical protein